MTNAVAKDPDFPMEHAQITELKSRAPQLFERAKHADQMITRAGETLGYVVSPEHYEFLVTVVAEAGGRVTRQFLADRTERLGSTASLDAAVDRARRGEFATPEQEAAAFETP